MSNESESKSKDNSNDQTSVKSKYPLPNLANATNGGLVDVFVSYKEAEAEAKFYVGYYREQISARLAAKTKEIIERVDKGEELTDEEIAADTNISGEMFKLSVSSYEQERFDVTAFKEAAMKDDTLKEIYRRFYKTSTITTYKTKPIFKEDK